MANFSNFFKMSAPSAKRVAPERADKYYKSLRMQSFLAGTFGYALYYVCRLSMGVMKKPLMDAGLLDAAQLGIIGACLYWAYAAGKLVNGFLADSSNIKRFMATGLIVSSLANFVMGVLGVSATAAGFSSSFLFIAFAVIWAMNGWAQSMGAPPAIIGLSRWFPLNIRGTFYGFFSASHNLGEGLSFIFVGSIVGVFGWHWGFFGAAIAGVIGVLLILFFLHDTPESKGLAPIEVLSGEKTQEEYDAEHAAIQVSAEDAAAAQASQAKETKRIQAAVIRNPGVWILALSSAFMYMSRYAINEWGVPFLQEVRGYSLGEASAIIGINPVFGIIGTVVSGWLSDVLFRGDRKYPAFVAGILEALSLALFLFGGGEKWIVVTSMVLFGIAIGVLIAFIGGLMAIDLVPRKATGAALGIVGMASYAAAGLQNVVTGVLLKNNIVVNELGEKVHDYTYVSWFWLCAAVISFMLPVLNWKRKQAEI
ncbi:MAG: MFS transporter [Bacteroidales bacterium]|nr:MFS transporter [Bacteroidales bacterium]